MILYPRTLFNITGPGRVQEVDCKTNVKPEKWVVIFLSIFLSNKIVPQISVLQEVFVPAVQSESPLPTVLRPRSCVKEEKMNRPQNLLLVYPEVPKNTYWSYKYALRFTGLKSAMPPLGLITLAALIPDSYNLKLVDMNIEPLDEADIQWADAVLISAMVVQKDSFKSVVDTCRARSKTIIAGGPYPTANYRQIEGVDHFVLGEVEDILSGFLTDLQAGCARRVYHAQHRPDIAQLPTPRFDLLDLKAYSAMSIQYSRGCPFRCEFCDIWTSYGNRPRLKSVGTIIGELDALYRLGWQGPVFIVDDNFIGNKKRVKNELLPALVKWQQEHRYALRFFTEASINVADDPVLLAGMRDSGFNEVFIGIETPSAASLKETGKTQNLKTDIPRAIQRIQRYGMEVMAGFILGFDSDTADIFERQIAFISNNAIPRAMVGLLNAMPGTALFDRLQKEGRIISECEGNNTHQVTTNFRTKMNENQLRAGYRKVLETLYGGNFKSYFARCNQLFDNLGDTTYFQRDIGMQEIRILVRTLLTQPFTRYGLQYIKFVIRSLVKHPGIFAETIRFGIMGHHFHIITREMLKSEAVVSALDESFHDLEDQLDDWLKTAKVNSRDAYRNLRLLWEQQKIKLEEIRKMIDRVHEDFREDVVKKYTDVSQKMKSLFHALPPEIVEPTAGI